MKNRILNLILIISLAFNLAFMGMFIWHRINDPHKKMRKDFQKMRKHMQPEMEELKLLRDDFKIERDKFMDFLRSDDFEETKADSILGNMLDKQMDMEEKFGQKLIEIRKNGTLPDFPPPPEGERPEGMNLREKGMFGRRNDQENSAVGRRGQEGMGPNGRGKNDQSMQGRRRGKMERSDERREK